MGDINPDKTDKPRGCPSLMSLAQNAYWGCSAVLLVLVVALIIGTLRDGHGGDRIVQTEVSVAGLSMALDQYRAAHGVYPPDRATGTNPALNKPAKCLVYFLSGGSIYYIPGVSPSDYPWKHRVYQDTNEAGRGRKASQIWYAFNRRMLADLDGDGLPAVVDPWGRPFLYNSGPPQDGPFNQNSAPRHLPGKFDLFSAGPDGKFGTEDDIRNCGSGKLPAGQTEYDYKQFNK